MAKYRNTLPQLSDKLFLTDGGLETTLIFHDKVELPYFASFDLLRTLEGTAALARLLRALHRHGEERAAPASCWRRRPGAPIRIGRRSSAIRARRWRRSTATPSSCLPSCRSKHDTPQTPMVISGNIGPRGDGYKVENAMTAQQAQDYHGWQVDVFARHASRHRQRLHHQLCRGGDRRRARLPGRQHAVRDLVHGRDRRRLPSGQLLRDAIEQTDRATNNGPAYYMLNCAHPTHFVGRADARRELDRAHPRASRQCVDAQPRRARCRARPRHRRSGRSRPPLPRAAPRVSALHRAGRLLRHRPPPRRADLPRLRRDGESGVTKRKGAGAVSSRSEPPNGTQTLPTCAYVF